MSHIPDHQHLDTRCLSLVSLVGGYLGPLPLLPHACFFPRSRIGCYVTVFQNISNLRDVFYREMSKVRDASVGFSGGSMVGLVHTVSLDREHRVDFYPLMK